MYRNIHKWQSMKKQITHRFGFILVGETSSDVSTLRLPQSLLNQGELKSGVVVAETYDDEVVSRIYRPYNNRILQVITKADGQFEKHLLASVAESYFFNQSNQTDWQSMMAIFAKPSLQFATFSITEKGYNLWQK